MVRNLRMFLVSGVVVGALAAGSLAIAGVLDKPQPLNVGGSKHFTAGLVSYQETPASLSTSAFGDFTADLVSDTQLHYTLRWSDLEGGFPLFAHVHLGQRGTGGGVIFFFCGSASTGPCPQTTAGEVSGDVGPADVIGPDSQGISVGEFDEMVKAMRAGYAYVKHPHAGVSPGRDPRPDQLELG